MIQLFNQKNKTIFIEGEESILKDLPPKLAKWGIKAVKNLMDDRNVFKIILGPLTDSKAHQFNRNNNKKKNSVICDYSGNTESSNTIKIKLNATNSKKIPELCKTVRRVCELV